MIGKFMIGHAEFSSIEIDHNGQETPLSNLDPSCAAYDPFLRTYERVSVSLRQLVHIVLTMEPDATGTQVEQRIHELRCPPAPLGEIEREYRRARVKCIATDYMIIRGTGYPQGDSPWMGIEAYLFPTRRRFDAGHFDSAPSDSREFHCQIEASYAIESATSGMTPDSRERRYAGPLKRAIQQRRLNLATAAVVLQVILRQCRVDLLTERDWRTLRDEMRMSQVGVIRFR